MIAPSTRLRIFSGPDQFWWYSRQPLRSAALEEWAIAQPWVSYGRDLPIIRRFWRQYFGSRPQLKPRLIVPDLTTLLEAVVAGAGLSVLPVYVCTKARAAQQLRYVWAPEPPVTNDLWVAFRV